MKNTISWTKCISLLLTLCFPELINGSICYMMYSMEDNNLEYFLRQDIEEYIRSNAIKDTSVVTWVYIDARNLDGGYDDIAEPLSNIYYSDGSNVTGTKYEGSYYLTYNHNLQKMVINTTLLQEQNSDQSTVVQQFLQYALTDCIQRGSTEYFAVFSSHGGGFAGYGGDENDSRRLRRRRLQEVQSNQNLTSAITGALAAVSGAPSKLSVLAFDACLMSDFGALDEFRAAADYVLASEATEPGHGFAYYTLDQTDSALALAKDMYDGYLTETQAQAYGDLTGGVVDDVHQTPKTLAIINTTAFTTFLQAWDNLSAELTNLLDTNNDSTLFTVLSRARSITLSFSGYLDGSSSQTPSLVDIGQFLYNIISLCSIDPSSQLAALVTSAQTSYQNMYVVQGVGPGTANATGMVILWPYQRAYDDAPSTYDEYLFNTSDIYATKAAPNWLAFLKLFYNSSISQSADTSTSVCRTSLNPTFQQTYEGQMILGPEVNFIDTTNGLLFSAQAALETDYIGVSYGLNVTSTLSSNRRLQNKVRHLASRSKNTDDSFQHVRRTQDASANYYYVYGGKMQVEYTGALVEAGWDRYYYLMNATDVYEVLYITDKGNGQKSFPVCYFSPVYPISSTDLEGIVDLTSAILNLGCTQGEMVFLLTQDGSYSLSLYAYDPVYSTYREVPSSSGGQIAPVTYVDLSVNSNSVTNIVGGFGETIIDWSPYTSFGILQLSDVMNMVLFDVPTGLIVASAFDFDNFSLVFGTGYDVYIYEYGISTNGTNTTGDGDGQNSSGSTGNQTQGGNGPGTIGDGTDQNSSGSTGNQTQGGNGSGQNNSGSNGGSGTTNGDGTTSNGAGQNNSGSAGNSGTPGQASSSRLSASFTQWSVVNCNIGLTLGFLTFLLT